MLFFAPVQYPFSVKGKSGESLKWFSAQYIWFIMNTQEHTNTKKICSQIK